MALYNENDECYYEHEEKAGGMVFIEHTLRPPSWAFDEARETALEVEYETVGVDT